MPGTMARFDFPSYPLAGWSPECIERVSAPATMLVVKVLVLGYRGRIRAVERWRVNVAVRTLAHYGGGQLVMSGYGGEAERLAALAPSDTEVVLETTARTTRENVERSLPLLEDADRLAI